VPKDIAIKSDRPTVHTYTGRQISLLDIAPDDIDLDDILRGTSLSCRRSGNVKHFFSVAQYQTMLSYLSEDMFASGEELAKAALFDYASMVYTGTIHPQLLDLFPDLRMIKTNVTRAIYERFNIDPDLVNSAELKYAQTLMEAIEWRDLKPWCIPPAHTPDPLPDVIINVMKPLKACKVMAARFRELFPEFSDLSIDCDGLQNIDTTPESRYLEALRVDQQGRGPLNPPSASINSRPPTRLVMA